MHRKWKKHLALLMTGSMIMLSPLSAAAQEAPSGQVQSGDEQPGPAPETPSQDPGKTEAPQANETPAAPAPQPSQAPQENNQQAPAQSAPQTNEAPAAPAPQPSQAPQENNQQAPAQSAPQTNEAPAAPAPQPSQAPQENNQQAPAQSAPQTNEAPAAPAPQPSQPSQENAQQAPQESAPQANEAPAAPAPQPSQAPQESAQQAPSQSAPQTNEAPAAPAPQPSQAPQENAQQAPSQSSQQTNETPADPTPQANETPAASTPHENVSPENASPENTSPENTSPENASPENAQQANSTPAAPAAQEDALQTSDPSEISQPDPSEKNKSAQTPGKAESTADSRLSEAEPDSVPSAVRNEADDVPAENDGGNNGSENGGGNNGSENGGGNNGSENGGGNNGSENGGGNSGSENGGGNNGGNNSGGNNSEGNGSGENGETQSPSISKTISLEWEDDDNQDNVRPGSLTAILVAVTQSGETEITRVDLKSENNWSATVDQVPTTDENGNPITYQWKWKHEAENPDTASLPESLRDLLTSLPGYAKPTDTVTSDENGDETVRHYTHKSAYVNHNVTIKWDDDNDANKLRPDHVTLTLPDGKTLTVYAKDNWTASIRLPVFKNGTRVEYEWTEEGITGYRLTLLETDGSDYILTNTWTTVTTEKTVTKTETVTETKEVPAKKKIVKTVKPKQVKLRIQYWNDTTQAFDSYEAVYEAGQKYNVVSPSMTGYSVNKKVVSGVIKSDTVINVKYKPKTYQVTIEYRFPDGTSAASSHTESVKTGSTFSVDSPQIQGYTADQATVSGTVTGRNLSYVVYYSQDRQQNQEQEQQQQEPQNQNREQTEPAQTDNQAQAQQTQVTETTAAAQPAAATASTTELVSLEDYDTPLGLGGIAMNAGDCFE